MRADRAALRLPKAPGSTGRETRASDESPQAHAQPARHAEAAATGFRLHLVARAHRTPTALWRTRHPLAENRGTIVRSRDSPTRLTRRALTVSDPAAYSRLLASV